MAQVKIGKAKYGGNKKTYFKLKDGDSVYRIVPPLGDLADEGFWSLYYRVHYGYKNAAGKSRPFVSSLVENRQNKMIEVPDAAVERLDKLKAQLEAAKKSGDKKTQEALFKFVGAPKSMYNLDNNHYMNVIDLQGNIGILKLRHKAKQALDLQIRKLRDKGIDPLSVDNGRYFVFTRSGKGNETQFQVSVFKKTINVQGVGDVEQDFVHALNDEVLNRLGDEAGELNKIFKEPTSAQIAQIVSESNMATGISPNIDAILGYKTNEAGVATDDGGGEDTPDVEEAPEVETKTEVKAQAQTQEPVAAQQAAPAPTPAQTPAVVETQPEPKKTTAPATTADTVASMSDKDFLKSLGLE